MAKEADMSALPASRDRTSAIGSTAPSSERRSLPRLRLAGSFTAAFQRDSHATPHAGESPSSSLGLAVLELKNGNHKGVAAICPIQVDIGCKVQLYAPGSRVPLHRGTVVRCETEHTDDDGSPLPRPRHVVAIHFDALR